MLRVQSRESSRSRPESTILREVPSSGTGRGFDRRGSQRSLRTERERDGVGTAGGQPPSAPAVVSVGRQQWARRSSPERIPPRCGRKVRGLDAPGSSTGVKLDGSVRLGTSAGEHPITVGAGAETAKDRAPITRGLRVTVVDGTGRCNSREGHESSA